MATKSTDERHRWAGWRAARAALGMARQAKIVAQRRRLYSGCHASVFEFGLSTTNHGGRRKGRGAETSSRNAGREARSGLYPLGERCDVIFGSRPATAFLRVHPGSLHRWLFLFVDAAARHTWPFWCMLSRTGVKLAPGRAGGCLGCPGGRGWLARC